MSIPRTTLIVIGTIVQELALQLETQATASTKINCEMREQLGGMPVNVSRAASAYCGHVVPYLMIGDDQVGETVRKELSVEFHAALFERSLPSTRRAILVGDRVYTTRPALQVQTPSQSLRNAMAGSPTIIGPLSVADMAFTEATLIAAPSSIWMPSADQLRDREAAMRLVALSNGTIMNDSEAAILTDCASPMDAIRVCRECTGGASVIITSAEGAFGWWDDNWQFAPALQSDAIRTVGGGDWFTGVFATARMAGYAAEEAMKLGQAAAARHVRALPPLSSLESLGAWAKTQPKALLAAKANTGRRIRIAASILTATSAVLAMALVIT